MKFLIDMNLSPPGPALGGQTRDATWTDLSTDQPFGTPFSRLLKNMLASLRTTVRNPPCRKSRPPRPVAGFT